MGRRPQPQVRRMVPVLAIVPAKILLTPGEVRNLILQIAAVLQKLPGQQKKFPLDLLIRQS